MLLGNIALVIYHQQVQPTGFYAVILNDGNLIGDHGWRDLNRGLEAAVYVRNITDEANVIGAIDFNNLTAFVNEPRMCGVELSKRF